MVVGKPIAVHGTQSAANKKTEMLKNSAQAYHMRRQQWQSQHATQGIGVSEYLDTRENHKQL